MARVPKVSILSAIALTVVVAAQEDSRLLRREGPPRRVPAAVVVGSLAKLDSGGIRAAEGDVADEDEVVGVGDGDEVRAQVFSDEDGEGEGAVEEGDNDAVGEEDGEGEGAVDEGGNDEATTRRLKKVPAKNKTKGSAGAKKKTPATAGQKKRGKQGKKAKAWAQQNNKKAKPAPAQQNNKKPKPAPAERPAPAPAPQPVNTVPAPSPGNPTVTWGAPGGTGQSPPKSVWPGLTPVPPPIIGSGPSTIQVFDRILTNDQWVNKVGCKAEGKLFEMRLPAELDLSPCQCVADTAGKMSLSVCSYSAVPMYPGPMRFRFTDLCSGASTDMSVGFEDNLYLLTNLYNPYYDAKRFATELLGRTCTFVHDWPYEFKFTGGWKLSTGTICPC